MTDRPILFSAPMVRALLEGRKTQTRRILKMRGHKSFSEFGPSDTPGYDWHFRDAEKRWHDLRDSELRARLEYAPGDRLWVRETWAAGACAKGLAPSCLHPAFWLRDNGGLWYPADNAEPAHPVTPKGTNHPGIHMPRWASRLTLIVTDVRVQRLEDISEADAAAEGAVPLEFVCCNSRKPARHSAQQVFAQIWSDIYGCDSILHGPNAWEANPWVCAVSFTVHQRNIDQMEAAA